MEYVLDEVVHDDAGQIQRQVYPFPPPISVVVHVCSLLLSTPGVRSGVEQAFFEPLSPQGSHHWTGMIAQSAFPTVS